MASSINALTSGAGGIVTTADNSGDLNIQSGGSTKIAVTSAGVAVTGTLSASGGISRASLPTAPCFGAYIASIQVPQNTTAEFAVTEIYDPTNAYATNGRFTPQTAGYYLVSANCNLPISGTGLVVINAEMYITKNGTTQTLGAFSNENTGMINTANIGCSKVIYLNGTTDYVSLKGYQYTYAGSNTWSFSQISFQALLMGV